MPALAVSLAKQKVHQEIRALFKALEHARMEGEQIKAEGFEDRLNAALEKLHGMR